MQRMKSRTGASMAAPCQCGHPGIPRIESGSARATVLILQGFPHLLVALRGPDARIAILCCFVVSARHVERQAVIEDDPASVLRLEALVRLLVHGAQILARGGALLHRSKPFADEGARAVEAGADRRRRLQ